MSSTVEPKAGVDPDNVRAGSGMFVGGGRAATGYGSATHGVPGTYPHSDDGLERTVALIRELGLERHAMELQLLGYTIVEPEKVAELSISDRALQRTLEIVEERLPLRCDLATGFTATSSELGADASDASPFGLSLTHVLCEDRVYEEILLNRALEALTNVCVGTNATLYTYSAFVKGPGSPPLPLHCDHHLPEPHPAAAYRCTAIWLLTDFSGDNGATVIVPGSHRTARQPMSNEGVDKQIVIQALRGSLVVFHGSTWHGALARTQAGLRVSLHIQFTRHFMHTSEAFRGNAPEHVLARNPERFQWLVGDLLHYEYGRDGADTKQMGRNIKSGEFTH